MKEIEIQQKKIKKLLELVQENPTLRIVPFVDYEVVCGDDFNTWIGSWGNSELDSIYESEERTYLKSCDIEDLVEKWVYKNSDDYMFETDEEIEDLAEEAVLKYKWEPVIVVGITT